MDIMSETLKALNFSGILFSQPRLQHPWAIREDSINGFLFHYVVEGNLKFRLTSEKKWSNIEPGDFILILSGRSNIIGSSSTAPIIHIDDVLKKMKADSKVIIGGSGDVAQVLCGCFPSHNKLEVLISETTSDYFHLKRYEINSLSLENYFKDLSAAFMSQDPGKDILIDSILKIIFLKVLNSLILNRKVHGPIPGIYSDEIVLKAVNKILSNLKRRWSVDDIAKVSGVSKNTLLKHFKEAVDFSPVEFSNFLKIQRAKDLLSSDHSIKVKELTDMFGYQSEENFLFNFKKFTKTTPKKYRENLL